MALSAKSLKQNTKMSDRRLRADHICALADPICAARRPAMRGQADQISVDNLAYPQAW